MPPADRAMVYGLPTVLRVPFILAAGVIIGGVELTMTVYAVANEIIRLCIVFFLLSGALVWYYQLAESHGKRYGVVDAVPQERSLGN